MNLQGMVYIFTNNEIVLYIIKYILYYSFQTLHLLQLLQSSNNLKTDSKTVRNVVKNKVNLLKNPV
jgi:hypothetical protein